MKDRVWTIPNVLTFIRIAMLPVFVLVAINDLTAGAIFISLLSITDLLDGFIARRYNQESYLGRILDPISDRALTLVSFTTFFLLRALPWWFVVLLGIRELLVSLGTLYIARQKSLRLDVNYRGKISAMGAMAATPFWVCAHESGGLVHTLWIWLAVISTTVAVAFGYWSLFGYLRAYKQT